MTTPECLRKLGRIECTNAMRLSSEAGGILQGGPVKKRLLIAGCVLAMSLSETRADAEVVNVNGQTSPASSPASNLFVLTPVRITVQHGHQPEYRFGTNSTATLKCNLQPYQSVATCVALEDNPAGLGVAEAAVEVSKHMKFTPGPNVPGGVDMLIPIVFIIQEKDQSAGSPQKLPIVKTQPEWIDKPTPQLLQKYYPKAALSGHISGGAKLKCLVLANGSAFNCSIVDEWPIGYGFGDAAIAVIDHIKLKPETYNGVSVAGGQVTVPFIFSSPPR